LAEIAKEKQFRKSFLVTKSSHPVPKPTTSSVQRPTKRTRNSDVTFLNPHQVAHTELMSTE